MIYDFPESSSPVAQGDIFFGIPILDLPDDELSIIDDASNVRTLPWETFASEGEPVSSIIAVRPTVAIVGTQECDALRAPNITLFEVRPFRDVERKSKETTKPSKWVPIITQHARINQKWFYLPADERVGFSEKMAADFLTPIRIPRLTLERLLGFRKGRLNEVAKQHFRERLADFFRRYAYDEWYPLTREELAEYQKIYPKAEPFPWQREGHDLNNEETTLTEVLGQSRKSIREYVAEGVRAAKEVANIISTINTERRNVASKLEEHGSQIRKLKGNAEGMIGSVRLIASEMNAFSTLLEGLSPKFAKAIRELDENYSEFVSSFDSKSNEQIVGLRSPLSSILSSLRPMKEGVIDFNSAFLPLKDQGLSQELSNAAVRQSQALESVMSNLEELESFALRMAFLIDEKIGQPPSSNSNDY